MKTNFRQRTSATTPARKRFAIVFLTLLILGFLFSFFRSPIISLAKPVWLTENAVVGGFKNLFNFLKSKNALLEENRVLREKLSSQEILLASFRVMEGSYTELLSNFGREPLEGSVPAGVLAHPPETPYDILILDVGALDGILAGDKVSLPEGGALGVVSEVFERESKVTLYSGSNVETNARLERGGVSLTLLGEGGGAFKTILPRETAVEVGDKILLPGLRAELIGVVVHVELNATDSEKKVLVRGVENISKIRFVSVK